ncbi:MAG: hypothetical protein RIG61_00245 [Deltaproteobacteria bacterium]
MNRQRIPALSIAALVFFITAAVYPHRARSEEQFGIPGADAATITECKGGTAYAYNNYLIYTRKSPSFEGQDIYIFDKSGKDAEPCSLDARKTYYTINAGEFQGSNTFSGIYKNYLFIDQWPGEEHKRLLAIDLPSRSLVFFDWYADPVIENGALHYNRVLKARKSVREKIPCPDARKWEAEGKTALYIEKMSVDLGTMKKNPSGEFSCKPGEAIVKRASDYNMH